MQYSNKNIEAYFIQLATEIKSLDDFSEDLPVAFVGNIEDKTLPNVGCDYIIRGSYTASELINLYSREYFMTMNCGYECEFISDITEIIDNKYIESMPSYPEKGSLQIVDGIIVVKFSE